MGRTAFNGPVYGALALLFSVSKESIAASATDLEIFEFTVPTNWEVVISAVYAYCDVQGNAGVVDVEIGGVSILTGNIALASDATAVAGVITGTAGEDDGGRVVPAASVITIDVTNGITTAIEDLTVLVFGFIRRVNTPA